MLSVSSVYYLQSLSRDNIYMSVADPGFSVGGGAKVFAKRTA